MVGKKLWLFVCLVLFLAGCGGGSQKAPATAPTVSETSPDGAARAGRAGPTPQDVGGRDGASPGDARADRPSYEGRAETFPAPAAPPAESSAGGREVASASKGTSSADAAPSRRRAEPAPESRPGLGTEYGESRTSRVHDVTFVRDAGRPFAVATVHYNDRRGVDALAAMQAGRDVSRGFEAGGGAVTVSIRDAGGEPLDAIHIGGRTLVVGQAGQRYAIVLQNHTSHRFEAVASVDGLDVINGRPGTLENRGYVLMPFATLEIEGFRQSTNAVAAFRFAAVSDSYAAQTGSARNVGVIGVAFFGERGDSFIPESELRLRDSASPFPADPRFAAPPPRR